MAAASSPGAHYPLRGLEHKGKNIKKVYHNLNADGYMLFPVFTLMSCRRPDMWICFIGKSQDLPEKQIRIAARGEERDSKTLRFFYCFCLIYRFNKIQNCDERRVILVSPDSNNKSSTPIDHLSDWG